MNLSGLSFDNIPPLKVPFGFFQIAPLFGIAAALLLATGGPDPLISRWHPNLLAGTHLLVLGFMGMVMVGALFQILPVISNRGLPNATRIAPWIRGGLITGASCLAAFFIFYQPLLLVAAIASLGAAFGLFVAALGRALWRVARPHPSITSIRLAGIALLMAVILGIVQATARLYADLPYQPIVTDLHLSNGLLGWTLLLVMGVSFQVIPMFHVAPEFPRWASALLPPMIFLCLLAGLPLLFIKLDAVAVTAYLLLAATGLLYAAVTLQTISKRKRKVPDATIRFWKLALCSLGAALILGCGLIFMPPGELQEQLKIIWGILLIVGFAISVIEGMLSKIIPFLLYLHLQQASMTCIEAFQKLPNMHDLLPAKRASMQFRLHTLALACTLISVAVPQGYLLAALALAADFAWLYRSLRLALGHYSQSQADIDRIKAQQASQPAERTP